MERFEGYLLREHRLSLTDFEQLYGRDLINELESCGALSEDEVSEKMMQQMVDEYMQLKNTTNNRKHALLGQRGRRQL